MSIFSRLRRPGVVLENKKFLRIRSQPATQRQCAKYQVDVEEQQVESYSFEQNEKDELLRRRVLYISLTAALVGLFVLVTGTGFNFGVAFGTFLSVYASVRMLEWLGIIHDYETWKRYRKLEKAELHRFHLFCEAQKSRGGQKNTVPEEVTFSVEAVIDSLESKYYAHSLLLLSEIDDAEIAKGCAWKMYWSFVDFSEICDISARFRIKYESNVTVMLKGIGQEMPGIGTWRMLIETFRGQYGDSDNYRAVLKELISCGQSGQVPPAIMRQSLSSLLREKKFASNQFLVELAQRLNFNDLLSEYIGSTPVNDSRAQASKA